jgi:mono/diheme cytochrome c family protein
MLKTIPRLIIVAAALTIAVTTPAAAQSTRSPAPSLAPESLAGRDSFELYCASCHGRQGKGDGPIASALKTRPADLSALASRNGGSFPKQAVVTFVEGSGRAVPVHGTAEMPVWGPIFRALERSDVRGRVRLDNLVAYVESLQVPRASTAQQPPAPTLTGAQLFNTYCASCHGPEGRGAGPASEQWRRTPPDLTKYTARNGGAFPSEKVRRIIDGRDVTAHGDRSMPVWGSVFSRERGSDAAAAAARIDALVMFLQSIQERAAE